MTPNQEKWLMVGSPVVLTLAIGATLFGVLRVRATDSGSESENTVGEIARPLPVEVTVLGELAAPQVSDTYRGLIVASKESELAFRRGGRVAAIEVKEGAAVKQGEILATLDASDVQADIEVARSQIAEADALLSELVAGPRKQTIEAAEAEVRRLEAAMDLAQTTAKRQQSLVEVNASSYQQLDDARSALDQQTAALASAQQRLSELREGTRKEQIAGQRSRVNSLKAQLRSLEVDLADSRIVAPFDGVISRRYLDEGAVVGPETRALRLLQIDPLEARFGVSPDDAASLELNQPVLLTFGQEKMIATVSRIEPEVDLVTRTQGLFVSIRSDSPRPFEQPVSSNNSRSAALVPGQTVSLSLAAPGSAEPGRSNQLNDQLWVPLGALSRADRGLWSLFVVVKTDDGGFEIERREVQVLAIEGELVRVGGALIHAGDRVISGALHRVTPGMKVEPMI
jgi:HlyD family secretion protein